MSDALRNALGSTRKRLLEISAQVRAAERRAQPAEARVSQKKRCPHTLAAAQAVYVLAGGDADVAQAYVDQKRARSTASHPWTDEGFASACAALDEADRDRVLAPETPEGVRAVAAAREFLSQHTLVQWVGQQNLTKGIAPTAAVAVQQLVTPSAPPDLVTPSAPRTWKRPQYERQWIRRWSRRFKLQRGSFKVGPRRPLATSRLKVTNLPLITTPTTPKKMKPRRFFF